LLALLCLALLFQEVFLYIFDGIFPLGLQVLLILLLFLLKFFKKTNKPLLLTAGFFMFLFITVLSFKTGSAFSLTERWYLFQKSLTVFSKYPLFGTGFGTFPLAKYSAGFSNPFLFYQPVHNVFLLVLVETGILFSFFLLYLFFKIIKYFYLTTGGLLLKTAIINVILLGLIDHYWITSVQNLLLLAFLISISVVRFRTNDS